MAPYDDPATVEACAARGLFAFAMELLPRITRAQAMDVLSSQSNLAGYFAVIDAAYHCGRALPMMMTAAGTVAAARVFVLGAGVAGLQAIATARRLGALVSATDVRPVAKEQVESLGAKFVAVEGAEAAEAETAGGYAREMGAAFQARQAALIAETLTAQDIAITTALIPGRPAPRLIDADMVARMRPGAVIVDLAAERGGNCALTRPGEIAEAGGVKIIGHMDGASRLAGDASPLYARNLVAFLTPLIGGADGGLKLDFDDEIVRGTLLTRECRIVHPAILQREPAADEAGG
jgi:NAD(P) transhydrogenase subunit alpha